MNANLTRLSPIGLEITGTDVDALLGDDRVPSTIMEMLDDNGVLVFPKLDLNDAQLVAFARTLGEIVVKDNTPGRGGEYREIFQISLDRSVNDAVYMKATVNWHIDGTTDEIPTKASLLIARAVPDSGGDTQFVSTYAAHDRLSDDEKTRFEHLKVVHSVESIFRAFDPDPTPETLERLRTVAPRVHPLVWTHRSGRKSLVIGSTAAHIEGMPESEGAAFLADLLDRATGPSQVLTHRWHVGDLVIWDNRGTLHRALPYAEDSGRRMHRVTLVGDEPIR